MPHRQRLSPEQRERLIVALSLGYQTRDRLDDLLFVGLDKRPDDFPGKVRKAIRDLVLEVEEDDQVEKLIVKAIKHSGNLALRDFHDDYFGLRDVTARGPEFESMVTNLGFKNLGEWIDRITAIQSEVCRVEVGDKTGTGFLVGPDLVITNYHVIEGVAKSSSPGIVLRFDLTRAGAAGSERTLARDWLVGWSRYSDADCDDTANVPPAADELDYALLRTETEVGGEPVGAGKTRGWQTLSEDAPLCAVDGPLVIVQHPGGEHMQLAVDPKAILHVGGARIRYRTNSRHGSSGSPCFDLGWNLVALHHSGDQSFRALWNEGIPIRAIAASVGLAAQRGS